MILYIKLSDIFNEPSPRSSTQRGCCLHDLDVGVPQTCCGTAEDCHLHLEENCSWGFPSRHHGCFKTTSTMV